MKKNILSLEWLKDVSSTLLYNEEELRRHANSIEAMAHAWLNVPVAMMSTGQKLIAALNIIERLSPDRRTIHLETAIRSRQHDIQQQYAECRLERDSQNFEIENRAAFFGNVKKPRRSDVYSEVVIANARAATGNDTIDSYIAASESLETIEAKSMIEFCKIDPLALSDDVDFFSEKINLHEPTENEAEKISDEKPRRNRKQKTE